jgi:hypothetical protein
MSRRPSVILIRELDEQISGGRCTCRARNELFRSRDPMFAERRQVMERMGELYRMLRYRFQKSIDIQIVDPRNVTLPIVLVGEFLAHGVGFGDALRTLFRMPPHAVLVNGRIVDTTGAPDVPAVVTVVASALERRSSATPIQARIARS